jgi:type II secretory ATPase GspE/PulE/Tfp pilus assembly ATPase PilB-like protein
MNAFDGNLAPGQAEPPNPVAPPSAFQAPAPVTLNSPPAGGSSGAATPEVSPLAAIAFSDLYLESEGPAWYKKAPNDRQGHRLTGELFQEARELFQSVEGETLNSDDSFTWRGIILRAKCLHTLRGPVYVLRRIAEKPMEFDRIGYPPKLARALMADQFNDGGLFLVAGRTGSGKTTTLTSYVVERLRIFGGTAVTAENPIEVQMQGRYEGVNGISGVCYQTQVADDREFGPRIKDFMRAAPNIIMLGELRTADAAGQAVLAGTSGHLVVVSVHGQDIISVIDRVKNLVVESGYDVSLFADCLVGVVHQQLVLENIDGEDKRRVEPKALIVKGSTQEEGIRAQIRGSSLEQMISEVQRQERVMKMPGNMGEF